MSKRNKIFSTVIGVTMVLSSQTFAAKLIDLKNQNVSLLQNFIALQGNAPQANLKQIRADVDFNQTSHIRMQQTYAGFPVWGSDIVVHIPRSTQKQFTSQDLRNKTAFMNGHIYQDLSADLAATPTTLLTSEQGNKALQHAVMSYEKKLGHSVNPQELKKDTVIYIDDDHKAHYAYVVSFFNKVPHKVPEKPTFIIDAATLTIYRQWNDLKTGGNQDVQGGGVGGTTKRQFSFDGLVGNNHLQKLNFSRNPNSRMCFLKNHDVTVVDVRSNKVAAFPCSWVNPSHHIYWDGSFDLVNGGYSPANDALYAGYVVKTMYQQWFKTPALVDQNGKDAMLLMRVHEDMENAYWDGESMTFGDGGSYFFPLTSLGIAAHEISHGFTQQHSNLVYDRQSGGLNESFSDMAAQTAEYFSFGQNSWQIGSEVMKDKGALRYMDNPKLDCVGAEPGWCSIDNVNEYTDNIDVHYSSGIYNKVFYLIGSAKGWNPRKAFEVMVKANAHYWTSTTTFAEAACGVAHATKDYGYDMATVAVAFKKVGIDISAC